MLEAILAFTFLSLVLLFYSIYMILFARRIIIQERLRTSLFKEDVSVHGLKSIIESEKQRLPIGLDHFFNKAGKFIPHKHYLSEKKKKLTQAAVLLKPEEFLSICLLSGAVSALILYLAAKSLILSGIGLLIGSKVPDWILKRIIQKRIKRLNRQLPEALTILANGIRAGYSFTQAMSVASKELSGPISEEFKKVIRENALGKPMDKALVNMSERILNEDIDMFVTALIIQRQVGGNLTEILDTICNTIRERIRVKGEINTLTAQSKFSAMVISLLPIGIAAVIAFMNTEYIKVLVTHTIGIIMLAVSAAMLVMGIFILRKIVDVDI